MKIEEYSNGIPFNELFPTTEDKITVVAQALFVFGFSLASYRSAYKRNWGAAIWKALVANQANKELLELVNRRTERAHASRANRARAKKAETDSFDNSWAHSSFHF